MMIVHVHHSFWPVLGGCEIAMQKLCEELVRLGHDVHVITSTYGANDRPKYEEINSIHIHRVKAWTLYFPDLTVPREVPGELLRRADIVHGWSQNSYFTYRICKEAKKLGKPVVMYFLGVDYLKHHYNPLIRLFGYPYQKWVTWKVVKITDLALVTNEYERTLLKERYGIDAIVLPHGIDELYLKLPNMAEYFRKKYGIEGRIIAYIGRIHPTKGLDLLIRAFAEVAKQVPDATLVIAGKGDERYLRKCLKLAERLNAKDKVKYIGYLTESDKIALIDASEVVILPTKHAGESYPLLVDEVTARGKPLVIVNASKALASRVSSLENVYIIDANYSAIANVVINILRETYSCNISSNTYVKSWGKITKKLVKLYKKLLDAKR